MANMKKYLLTAVNKVGVSTAPSFTKIIITQQSYVEIFCERFFQICQKKCDNNKK